MKEISYIHSEAYAAGKFKHSAISQIENGILVIGFLTQRELFEKAVSNLVETKSHVFYLAAISTTASFSVYADFTIYVSAIDEHFMAILTIIPLQIIGYYIAAFRVWTGTLPSP